MNNINRNSDRKVYFREISYDTKRFANKTDENLAKDIFDGTVEILF